MNKTSTLLSKASAAKGVFGSIIGALTGLGLTSSQAYGVIGVIALLIGLVMIKFGGAIMKFLIIALILFVVGVAIL